MSVASWSKYQRHGPRRPTARDRDVASAIMRLPVGQHTVIIEESEEPPGTGATAVVKFGPRRIRFLLDR